IRQNAAGPRAEVLTQYLWIIRLGRKFIPAANLILETWPQLFQGVNHMAMHHEKFISVLWPGALVLLGSPLHKRAGIDSAIAAAPKTTEATAKPATGRWASTRLMPKEMAFLPNLRVHPCNDFRT